MLPQKVAIIHCNSHQRGTDPITKGNNVADQATRSAAMSKTRVLTLSTLPEEKVQPGKQPDEPDLTTYLQQALQLTHLGIKKTVLVGSTPKLYGSSSLEYS